MDKLLQDLADSPIKTAARASKIFLPLGKRSAPRAEKRDISPDERREAKEYRAREASAKVKALLDYYGTTTVPFDRIADHMKMDIRQVRESMKMRGRLS